MELTWVSIIIIGLLLINLFVRFASNIKFSRIAAKFYRAMRSSKVVDGRVTLTAGTGFPMKGFECRSVMDETMFVREVHEHIVLLFENYCRNGRMPAMVVRGPAGNGKVKCVCYILFYCKLSVLRHFLLV